MKSLNEWNRSKLITRWIDDFLLLLFPKVSSTGYLNISHLGSFFFSHRIIYFFFFLPLSGFKLRLTPCGHPLLSREGVKLKLARRCVPSCRSLCIASACFLSSSCWLWRLRSVPTRTGRTRHFTRLLLLWGFYLIKRGDSLHSSDCFLNRSVVWTKTWSRQFKRCCANRYLLGLRLRKSIHYYNLTVKFCQ